MQRRDRQRGTTLIEILVSLVLLSVGLLGLVGLHARTLQTSVDAQQRSDAALLANEIVTAMWLTHDASNNSAVSAAFTNWQAQAARALPSASYSVGTPDASGAVRITLNWQSPSQQANAVTSQYFTTVVIP